MDVDFHNINFSKNQKGIPFYMHGKTLKISRDLHALNRSKLCKKFKGETDIESSSIIFLQGGKSSFRYCTDVENVFRQESFFHWTFGVEEPNCYGAVRLSDCSSILFIPKLDECYTIWCGHIPTLNDIKIKYGVDEVHYTNEMSEVLLSKSPHLLLILRGKNSDSGSSTLQVTFDGIEKFKVNDSCLYDIICECRVIKTPLELEVLRYANRVSSAAHRQVMRSIRPGMKEYELEALFSYLCYKNGGCRHVAYTCICASGHNAAILHYGHASAPNNRIISSQDLCLFDMGAEYYCYASDITCTFPVNGHFTPNQKILYEAVLDANRAVFQAIKPGVSWMNMHQLACRVILTELKKADLLQGEVEDMMSVNLAFTFFPHGLGHLMGCDVHDVGGYLQHCPPRPTLPGLKNLRTARLLQAGMVLTIEPGCYFIDKLLDDALQDPGRKIFIVEERLKEFRGIGGVRIEDNIIVTMNGAELMTDVPRTIQEIEEWMSHPSDGLKIL